VIHEHLEKYVVTPKLSREEELERMREVMMSFNVRRERRSNERQKFFIRKLRVRLGDIQKDL
jgi:hypothetical protein